MGANSVFVRLCAMAIVGLAASGCANDKAGPFGGAQHLGAGSLQVSATAVAAGRAGIRSSGNHDPVGTSSVRNTQDTADANPHPIKKTLAGKMLTAMALERATGRKPDPSRLTELD